MAKKLKLKARAICPCCLEWKKEYILCDGCGLLLCADCQLQLYTALGYCPDCYIMHVNSDAESFKDHGGVFHARA